eukprot:TRINITY_DN10969_c0_g1_i2.p1 TRINITY_DN10969_c0_g1~~TRINITY_DN10969_c0_g1_i2.p1  ORF type:complete len:287 (-),score=74.47 TRINITY_DN10969_c0_g1_i2:332-1192(-)
MEPDPAGSPSEGDPPSPPREGAGGIEAMFRRCCYDNPERPLCKWLDRDGPGQDQAVRYGEMELMAGSVMHLLHEQGLTNADAVLLVYDPGLELVVALWGCWFAGVRAVPVFLTTDACKARVLPAIAVAGTALILTQRKWVEMVQGLELPEGTTVRVTDFGLRPRPTMSTRAYAGGEVALVHLADDGRTVEITHDELQRNLAGLHEQMPIQQHDVAACWMPLPREHDDGLVACILLVCVVGAGCVVVSPESCISKPATWLSLVTTHRITAVCAPNFAYQMLVDSSPG